MAASTTLDYFLPELRLHLGDIDPATYRYTDEWLEVALEISIKALGRWWNLKYLLDSSTKLVTRNPNLSFVLAEPPVIEMQDERPILLMASIVIKEGSLEANSWSAGAWRDAEISFSNLEGSRSKQISLKKDWEELSMLLSTPKQRLAQTVKGSLKGYKGNQFENMGDF
ncbi:MAG: hypothetical protein ACW99G_07995 [Candidatus Thorarchaeota archaeon]|jgi:hypothetical protein